MNRISNIIGGGNRPISTNNDDSRMHDNRSLSMMMGNAMKTNVMTRNESISPIK